MHGTDIVSAIIARKTIASTEVTWLRQEVFKDGVTDDKEAEVIFRLNEECTEKDESWDQLYVDVLTDYFVWQASPRGYVDEGHARYLMQRIAGNNRIESSPELELLVNVIHWADHCPPELAEVGEVFAHLGVRQAQGIAELYERQSPHSVMVIRSIRLHHPVNVRGKRSAMPPGLQPEACRLTLPFLQAASSRLAPIGFLSFRIPKRRP